MRGLSRHPSGPLPPVDALEAGRADTPTPCQLTATRRSLSCALFLTPSRAAATAAPETAAPPAASRRDRSVQRPWRASAAASAWPSPYHGVAPRGRHPTAVGVRQQPRTDSYGNLEIRIRP